MKKVDPFDSLPKKARNGTTEAWIRRDVAIINPRFHEGPEWRVNCQRASVAYELRRRGFDVAARPNHKGKDKQYTFDDIAALARTRDRWMTAKLTAEVEPDTPGAIFVEGEEPRWLRPSRGRDVRRVIEGLAWPPGARGWIAGVWKDGKSAHIWCWEIGLDGDVIFLDPQTNTVKGRAESMLADLMDGAVYLMRTDDLIPAEEMVTMVQAAEGASG